MIIRKCPNCGTQLNIDENISLLEQCPSCHSMMNLENDEEIVKKKDDLCERIKELFASYSESGDSNKIRSMIESFGEPSFYLSDVWMSFILDVTGVATAKNDKLFQTYLKNYAKKYDAKRDKVRQAYLKNHRDWHDESVETSDVSLYASIFAVMSQGGTNNDLFDLIKQTGGDEAKFAGLIPDTLNYIVTKPDKAFAMDIFNLISAHGDEWAGAGRMYIRALLSSDDVANTVFPKSAFNGVTKKFIKRLASYCKKYLSGGNEVTLEETRVWENYLAARKAQKRRNVIIAATVTVVVAGTACGVGAYLNAPNKDTIKFNVDKVIETIYGEALDLSKYTVTYQKNIGTTVEEKVTLKMLSGYNPEKVGEQSNVKINFDGVSERITIIVKNSKLDAPKLTQTGNYVSWEIVPNTEYYSLYVNSTLINGELTTLTYDLSQLNLTGELSITARAETSSEKFDNSVLSDPLVVTKLKNPDGVKYENGVLGWNAVDGAVLYEVVINNDNAVPVNAPANTYEVALNQGANKIKITVKGTDGVVHGVSVTDLNYVKLSGISALTYANDKVQWEADSRASSYDIYVGGEFWKTFNRKNFDVVADGFAERFGNGLHEIGIVSKALLQGSENSDMVVKKVYVGNKVSVEDESLVWDSVGVGAAYFAECNGKRLDLNSNILPFTGLISESVIKAGDNVITLSAKYNDEEIVLETVTLKKLATPKVTIADTSWTGNDEGLIYTLDGTSVAALPEVSSLSVGEHTVTAKRERTSATAFEVDSDVQTLKILKLAKPTFYIEDNELICNYDKDKYELRLTVTKAGSPIGSALDDIRDAGEYDITAVLSAKRGVATDYDAVASSEPSEVVTVTKLAAPDVIYSNGDSRVTSSVSGAKFFYIDDNGQERELAGGLISNLPQGVFDVYARAIALERNVLTSEPTPNSGRAHIFNMNLTLSANKVAGSQALLNAVFDGCTGISELSFTYQIKYYDAEGNLIASKTDINVFTAQKANESSTFIVHQINYLLGVSYISGYSAKDISKIELIIDIKGGSEDQRLITEMSVR